MKKIFYFLASAIVALGAMACQNEVDENITPENTNEITFNVSFDESTRIAGTVADGKATFTFDGKGINGIGESVADSLYVGYSNFNGESYDTKRAALTNTEDAPLTFTADQENMSILNSLVGVDNVYAVNRNNEAVDSELGANGLLFRSEIFEVVAGENNITLSLACPALYFTVPAETTVALTAGSFEKEFTEGNHWVAISPNIFNKTIAISYSIGGEVMKEKTLTNLTNKVYNLGTLGTVMTVADVAELIDNAEAGSTITLPVGATINGSEILTINKNITIDGNGATLRSTAGRAINVSGEGVEATIENLTVVCSGERGVNVIQNAKSVTLNEVNITAANYAVNVAGSAGDVTVTISNSTITGLNAVNVAGAGATVTVDNCIINCEDNNSNEGYSPISLNKDGVNGTITVTNSTINITGEYAEDTTEGSNAAKGGTVTINGSTEKVSIEVCYIEYGDYYYAFTSVADAIEYANEKDNSATIVLLRDAEIAQVGTFNIDVNDCTLTAAEGYNLTIDEENNTVTVVKVYTVYVTAQPKSSAAAWETINLYAWNNSENNTWPGVAITANTKEINGYTYHYFTFPASFNNTDVSVIVNNGTQQTPDIVLGTLDKDYYVVYSTVVKDVLTEAPAADSIEEYVEAVTDPKPATTTVYLKTDWTWTEWALWGWSDSGNWFKNWPGNTLAEVIIGENTYKACDVPAEFVTAGGANTIIISGMEWGERKQTADFNIANIQSGDIFVEIYWDSAASQAKLRTIASPYTE